MDIPTSKNPKLVLNDNYPKVDHPKAGILKDTKTILDSENMRATRFTGLTAGQFQALSIFFRNCPRSKNIAHPY